MKKSILIVSLFAFAGMFNACKKDKKVVTPTNQNSGSGSDSTGLTVDQKQRSLLVYSTATWCGPCGQAGSPIFKTAIATEGIIGLNFQSSGSSDLVPHYKRDNNDTPFIAPFIIQLSASNRPNGYIPHFCLNNTFMGNTATNPADLVSGATSFNAVSPTVGVAAKASLVGSKFSIVTKAKWFNAGSGEYFTTAFIVEKITNHRQAVGSNYQSSFEHKKIIRATTAGNETRSTQSVFKPLASGTVAVNTEKVTNLSFTWTDLPQIGALNRWLLGTASNYTVVVVVYKKNGSLYDFVNGIEVNVN